jgi:Domain of unknown function (DUF4145)
MCRKTLEGLCESQGVNSPNLASSLEELKNRKIIDQRLFDWANALRITGNEAAHGVKLTLTRDDAKDVLDFTEAIVDYVFVYRQRFDEFMSRKRTRQAPRMATTDKGKRRASPSKEPTEASDEQSSGGSGRSDP